MGSSTTGLPLVSVVGRPNVGKSTLFNKLAGKRLSIVDDVPGVTRDRIFARCRLGGVPVHLVDTGGLTTINRKSEINASVEKQIMMSVDSSIALIFVVDCASGVTPEDLHVADVLRKSRKPVILVANKADSPTTENLALDFHSLGFGEPLPVSALNSRNIDSIGKSLLKILPSDVAERPVIEPIRFCIVGRPNVGKSSLCNAIFGEDRSVVSSIPGTTRDRVDTDFERGGERFVMVDTAGIKRKKLNMDRLEFFGFTRAKTAIADSEVCVLVLDAVEGVTEGDKRIADSVNESKKGLVIVINKMDLIEAPDHKLFLEAMYADAPFLRGAPVLFISAMMKKNINAVLQAVCDVRRRLRELLPLELLKNVIYDVRALYSPRSTGKRLAEIIDVQHDRVSPPRIIVKVNDKELFPTQYMRLMENRIRAVFNLSGVPLELILSSPEKLKKKKK